jgi:hypothetical protein
MPYRIKARCSDGNTVTRLDLRDQVITDKRVAQQEADAFAATRKHSGNGTWVGIVEYYDEKSSIANPNWDRKQNGLTR